MENLITTTRQLQNYTLLSSTEFAELGIIICGKGCLIGLRKSCQHSLRNNHGEYIKESGVAYSSILK